VRIELTIIRNDSRVVGPPSPERLQCELLHKAFGAVQLFERENALAAHTAARSGVHKPCSRRRRGSPTRSLGSTRLTSRIRTDSKLLRDAATLSTHAEHRGNDEIGSRDVLKSNQRVAWAFALPRREQASSGEVHAVSLTVSMRGASQNRFKEPLIKSTNCASRTLSLMGGYRS
jgi:hypothetical protein